MGVRSAILLCFCFLIRVSGRGQDAAILELSNGRYYLDEAISYTLSDRDSTHFPFTGIVGLKGNLASRPDIRSSGLELKGYLSPGVYYARFNRELTYEELERLQIRFITPVKPEWKLHPLLEDASSIKPDSILFLTTYFHDWNEIQIRGILDGVGATTPVLQKLTSSVRFQLVAGQLQQLLESDPVYWIEPAEFELEMNNLVERTNHRIPYVDKGGGKYKLSGKGVVVGEWDGTAADQHIDYAYRHFPQEAFANNSNGRHATHVAGTVLGAGIKDPDAEGMAPEAKLYSYDFQGPIPYEMDTSFQKFRIDLTQNSYSYGSASDRCNVRGTYDGTSRALDALTYNYTKFLHVFAAGNSRSSNCKSGGYGTVHSGFQASKNSLVVGAVTNIDGNSSFHSYGPVRDGRLKPEVCAVGVNVYSTFPGNNYQGGYSGTSMACPGTSGSAALLYEYYHRKYQSDPPANLIKGLLCNGADELGRSGPDYQYGFGRINVRRSVEILDSGHFRLDSVSSSRIYTDTIFISPGTTEFKIFLCWDDPTAVPSAPNALVNDLDLEVFDSAGGRYRPWILNPVNYTSVAVRGRDSLNNSEQVTLANPVSPYLVVRVSASRMNTAFQRFSLNWLAEDTSLTLIYPNGGEHWEPPSGNTTAQTIRWDSYDLSGTSRLEYSLDSGATWNVISNSIPADRTYHVWNNAPSNIGSRKALIRITKGGKQDVSDEVFDIYRKGPSPTAISCDGQLHLKWNPVPGVAAYAVYLHDSGKMIRQGTTNYPFFTLRGLDNSLEYWVAVSAIDANGAEGPRSDGVPFRPTAGKMAPNILRQPLDIKVCTGLDTAYSTIVLGDSPLRLFWDESRDNGKTWRSMGVQSSRLNISRSDLSRNGRLYRLKAVNGCEDTVYSRSALLHVDTALRFTYSDTKIQLCLEQDTQIQLHFQAPNEPVFQWFFQKTLSSNPQFLSGFKETLTIQNATESKEGYYYAQLRNFCGTYIGQQLPFVEVHPPLQVSTNAIDTVCVGAAVQLEAIGQGGDTLGYRYTWNSGARTSGLRKFSYYPDSNEVWTVSLFDECSADTVFASRMIVMRDTLRVNLGPDQTICLGQTITLTAIPSGGDAAKYAFLWQDEALKNPIREVAPIQSTTYKIVLDDACTLEDGEDEIVVTVLPALEIELNSERDTQCFGQETALSVNLSGGTPNGYAILWNDGDSSTRRIVSPKSSQKYSVTLRDGCTVKEAVDSFYLSVRQPLRIHADNSHPIICYGLDTLLTVQASGGEPGSRLIRWSTGESGPNSVRVKPNQTTNYFAVLSDGCSEPWDSAHIQVKVLAPLRLNVEDVRKCAEDTLRYVLRAMGGRSSTYRYYVDNAEEAEDYFNATDTLGRMYRIRVSDGCTPLDDSTNVMVAVNPLNLEGFTLKRRNGKTVHLQSESSPNSIRWILGDGTESSANTDGLLYTYANYGRYRICRIEFDDFGCADTFCMPVNLYDPYLTDAFDIRIYPNPAQDLLWIEMDSIAAEIRIELLDMSGRMVWKEEWTNLEYTKWSVDLSPFAQGTYVLRMYANGEVYKHLLTKH